MLNQPVTSDMVFNYLLSRSGLAQATDLGHEDSTRNMDKACNYPENPSAEFFRRLYRRGDIAARVVDIWPLETWSKPPDVYETEDPEQVTPWEAAWKALEKQHRLISKLVRLDKQSGVGRYGVMLLGLPGAADMPAPGFVNNEKGGQWVDTPPQGTQLLYTRIFDEYLAPVASYETNTQSPRYGLPTSYRLTLVDHTLEGDQGTGATASKDNAKLTVHWTRVLHLADNLTSSEVFGEPRMENVLNRILDIRKVAGGSGEMFWKGGFPGYSFEVDPKNTDLELDKDSIKTEMRAFSDGLQRYIAMVGIKVNSLSPQVADPTAHVDTQLKLICVTKGYPLRIFTGSEQGQLASSQDQKAWNDRVAHRQTEHAEPNILLPLLDRLGKVGVLPPLTAEEELTVVWPDRNTTTENEKADALLKRVQALAAYLNSNAQALVPPLEFLVDFLGMTPEKAVSTLEAALEQMGDEEALGNNLTPPAGEPVDATDEQPDEGAAGTGAAGAKQPASKAGKGKAKATDGTGGQESEEKT